MYTKEFRPQLAAKSVHLDVLSHEIDKEKKLVEFYGNSQNGLGPPPHSVQCAVVQCSNVFLWVKPF